MLNYVAPEEKEIHNLQPSLPKFRSGRHAECVTNRKQVFCAKIRKEKLTGLGVDRITYNKMSKAHWRSKVQTPGPGSICQDRV